MDDLQPAIAALVPAGLTPEDVSVRIRKGDLVSVGFLNGIPAGYTWTRFGDVSAKELGLTIHPRTREVIQYDSLVLKRFRRHGLQFAIAAPDTPPAWHGLTCSIGRRTRTSADGARK